MAGESGTLTDRFPTLGALVGLFASVRSAVCPQVRAVGETLCTLTTLTGFLSCVDSLVHNKACALREACATLPTFIGLFSCVDSLVCDEVRMIDHVVFFPSFC